MQARYRVLRVYHSRGALNLVSHQSLMSGIVVTYGPMLDKEGVAIILCESGMAPRYQELLAGLTVLESTLHKQLVEHIASEVNLGTITGTATARTWLRNSFFFQRIQRNPSHYASIGLDQNPQSWQERTDNLVTEAVTALEKGNIISAQRSEDGHDTITITELGEIMSKVSIGSILETM